MWRRYCYLTSFSDCQYALVAKIWPNKVVRWCRDCEFLRPALSASRMQYISDLHSKFALRPHHGKKKKKKEETGQKYNVRVCLYNTKVDVRSVWYTHLLLCFRFRRSEKRCSFCVIQTISNDSDEQILPMRVCTQTFASLLHYLIACISHCLIMLMLRHFVINLNGPQRSLYFVSKKRPTLQSSVVAYILQL